jgi:hypothetical protein
MQGTLRLVRTGNTESGYYMSGGNWILIHSGGGATGPVPLSIVAWSRDYAFNHQNVQLLVSGFRITQGQLSCPHISLSPDHGPIGTKVIVRGTGLPSISNLPVDLPSVQVTFDDMFLGTASVTSGSFNFTLDVPNAQIGIHQVKATDFYAQKILIADFQVTSGGSVSSGLSITVSSGTIYFPGDTAVASILVSVMGSTQSPSLSSVQATLFTPQNATSQLTVQSTTPGLYSLSYQIPAAAKLGTYTIRVVAVSTQNGSASTIVSFEVKPTWLASHGQQIAVGGVATLGVTGLAVTMWYRGSKKRTDLSF